MLLRPAAARFHSQLDWLDSWHSFSFAQHHDPAWMGFGPLRVINDDTIAAGRGFGMHPHRDMEIVTVMVDGELHHRDDLGHAEVLRAGEVQWMSAGTGVLHSEFNGGDRPCRLLQIWIQPSRTGLAPAYAQNPFAIGTGWTLLLDPEGREGAMAIQRPVRLWRAQPRAGQRLSLPVMAGRMAWLQLIDGATALLVANPSASQPSPLPSLQRGDGLGWQVDGSLLELEVVADGTDLLLFELA